MPPKPMMTSEGTGGKMFSSAIRAAMPQEPPAVMIRRISSVMDQPWVARCRAETRRSFASQIMADVSVPLKVSIATMPVGEVTLISVSHCPRSEEHTSELQSLMRISYAVFCLKKKKNTDQTVNNNEAS